MSDSSIPNPPQLTSPNEFILGRKIHGVHQMLFGVSIAAVCASVLTLFAELSNFQFWLDVKNASFTSEAELMSRATQADDFTSSANQIYFLVYLTLFIVFLVWCNKMTKNLNDLGYQTSKGSKWVVGSFFIPIANFFLVFGSIKDLLTGFGRHVPALTNDRQKALKMWWILISISTLLNRATYWEPNADAAIEQYLNLAGFSAFVALFNAISFGFGVKAFKQLRDSTKRI